MVFPFLDAALPEQLTLTPEVKKNVGRTGNTKITEKQHCKHWFLTLVRPQPVSVESMYVETVAREFVGLVFHVLLDGAKGFHNHWDCCV